jgi:hypothetical protein
VAPPKPRSRKRTYAYLIRSMRTLRFLLVTRAGRLTRIGGRHVLRLTHNPATETLYASINHRLAAWVIFGLGLEAAVTNVGGHGSHVTGLHVDAGSEFLKWAAFNSFLAPTPDCLNSHNPWWLPASKPCFDVD